MKIFLKWTNSLLSLLFPRRCSCCGERLNIGEEYLCVRCLIAMPRTHYHLYPGNEMEQRFWGKIELERASALFHFEKHEGYRSVIHELKYKNAPQLAVYLGRIAVREMQKTGFFEGVDSIVPVPLHWRRKWNRGYNQSEMIGRGVAAESSLPLRQDWVKRIRNNESQTLQSGVDRWENVRTIFRVKQMKEMEGKHILLVDDVCTSGSTLEALAAELQKTAKVKISILTLAVARFRLPKEQLY